MTDRPATPIYLDHAATTPLDPAVLEAMLPYLRGEFANPSSLYRSARATREAVETARKTIADILGAKPTEIIFTSGSTESNNAAVQGVLRAHPGAGWVTTAIEHDAILAQVKPLAAAGHAATVVPVKPTGLVDPAAIAGAITDDTVLVSVMHANNEIGTIQPVADIAKLIAKVRADRAARGLVRPLYLHTDATQAAGYLDLHVTRLGADLLTLNGSKIYGPKGTGLLYVRTGTQLEPLMYGGGQERGRRSGTENVAGLVGLAAALRLAATTRAAEARRQAGLRDQLLRQLQAALPDAILNGDARRRLPNNLNLTIPGADGESLILYLDNAGLQASTGSACSTGNLDPSHVLLALGRTTAEADCSLRLTLGRGTTPEHIEAAAEIIPGVVERVRELSISTT
ncbi:MAG TPA: cysteine desulfurase family protein [Candidatus Saccharimonadia bacterium]